MAVEDGSVTPAGVPHVVVGVDGSDESIGALKWAANYAEESRQADLLVVGHRGHGAFTGMLLGSVSMHCVTNAACPVVVVRSRS
jgi:nucleotide-binding universal stress UspA family protein